MVRDYYAILEVPCSASADDIRAAYCRLAMKYHPDMSDNNPGLTEKFREIADAYAVLKDASKRAEYDASRTIFTTSYGGRSYGDRIRDIFGSYGSPRTSPRREDIIPGELQVDIENGRFVRVKEVANSTAQNDTVRRYAREQLSRTAENALNMPISDFILKDLLEIAKDTTLSISIRKRAAIKLGEHYLYRLRSVQDLFRMVLTNEGIEMSIRIDAGKTIFKGILTTPDIPVYTDKEKETDILEALQRQDLPPELKSAVLFCLMVLQLCNIATSMTLGDYISLIELTKSKSLHSDLHGGMPEIVEKTAKIAICLRYKEKNSAALFSICTNVRLSEHVRGVAGICCLHLICTEMNSTDRQAMAVLLNDVEALATGNTPIRVRVGAGRFLVDCYANLGYWKLLQDVAADARQPYEVWQYARKALSLRGRAVRTLLAFGKAIGTSHPTEEMLELYRRAIRRDTNPTRDMHTRKQHA